jgi:hypothetical protein
MIRPSCVQNSIRHRSNNVSRCLGQLLRSCVELAKNWRTDKYMRHLDATLLVVDKHLTLELTGRGDVLVRVYAFVRVLHRSISVGTVHRNRKTA